MNKIKKSPMFFSLSVSLIILFMFFQNCSNTSLQQTGTPSEIAAPPNLSTNTNPTLNSYSEYEITSYFPNYFKSAKASEIISTSAAGKILVFSNMVEYPGFLEIDVKNQFIFRNIYDLEVRKWTHAQRRVQFNFNESLLLALLPSDQIYKDRLIYTYGVADEAKLNQVELNTTFKELVVLSIKDYKKKFNIKYVMNTLVSNYSNYVAIDYYDNSQALQTSWQLSQKKVLDLDTGVFYSLPSSLKISDIHFINNSNSVFYSDLNGLWKYDFITTELVKISDVFKLGAYDLKFEPRFQIGNILYINGQYKFNDLFYYECSFTSLCGIDNYLYTYDLVSKKIDAVFKVADDKLTVSKMQYYLLKFANGQFIYRNSDGQDFTTSPSGRIELYSPPVYTKYDPINNPKSLKVFVKNN